jgi:hypothetical protein
MKLDPKLEPEAHTEEDAKTPTSPSEWDNSTTTGNVFWTPDHVTAGRTKAVATALSRMVTIDSQDTCTVVGNHGKHTVQKSPSGKWLCDCTGAGHGLYCWHRAAVELLFEFGGPVKKPRIG